MSDSTSKENVFKNVSRLLPAEEQAAIESIELEAHELDEFMEKLRQGMIQAASASKHAVQDNFALRVETTIKLSRPVYNEETDKVEDLVGKAEVSGEVKARKIQRLRAESRRMRTVTTAPASIRGHSSGPGNVLARSLFCQVFSSLPILTD